MTSFTSRGHIFLSGVSIVTSLNDTSAPRVRQHLRSCLRLTNPCSKRKVLSLTKPKGKIYKTKSLGYYITWYWPYFADPTNAQRIPLCLRSLSVEIRKSKQHLSTVKTQISPQWQKVNFSTQWPLPQSCNSLFFKILKFSGPSLRAWPYPHSSPISFLRFIMTMLIAKSFAPVRKTVLIDYAPELLTRFVQSPTKLNDKI